MVLFLVEGDKVLTTRRMSVVATQEESLNTGTGVPSTGAGLAHAHCSLLFTGYRAGARHRVIFSGEGYAQAL